MGSKIMHGEYLRNGLFIRIFKEDYFLTNLDLIKTQPKITLNNVLMINSVKDKEYYYETSIFNS